MLQRVSSVLGAVRSETPRGRMLRGVGANLYDKSAVLLVQLLSIPVLTAHWGVEGYGIWLMLLTIPTYIQLSDFGVGTAAGVEITERVAKKEYPAALEVLHSAWAFILSVVLMIAAIAILYSAYLFFSAGAQDVGPFGQRNLAIAIVLVVFYSILVTQMSLLSVVYRATNKFATGMAITGSVLFAEGLFAIVAVWSGQGLLFVAAGYVVIRFVGYLGFLSYLRRLEPWVVVGLKAAKKQTLKRLASPSFAAMLLTLSNALVLQGTLLTLGWFYSPAAVAVFGAARTFSRIPLQFSGLFLRPSIPELTRAIVSGDLGLTRKLTGFNILVALIATVPFAAVIIGFGPEVLSLISGGKLSASTELFGLLLAAVVANAVWTAAASPLIATNRQGEFAYIYAFLCLCVALTPLMPGSGMIWVGVAMAVVELLISIIVIRKIYFLRKS